jgi:hypothetical protein
MLDTNQSVEQNLSSECNNFSANEAIPGIYVTSMFIYLFSQKEMTNPDKTIFFSSYAMKACRVIQV